MVDMKWSSDLYPLINKTFESEYDKGIIPLKQIIEEVKYDGYTYKIENIGGYGELSLYSGDSATPLNQKRGFITTIQPAEYAGMVDVHFKNAKIDKSGEAHKVGTRLARSASMTVYMHLLRMFKDAYTGPAGGDGQRWASNAHPVASKGDVDGVSVIDTDAGTYSNLINTELSVPAITAAQCKANGFLTPDGLPFLCDFDTLLVSPELEAKAKEICGADKSLIPERLPESNLNSANPIYGMGYIVVKGFGAKQWAVCDRTLMKEAVKLIYNEKPTVLKNALDNPLISRFTAYVDFGLGWGDARQIIFSNPA